MLLTALSKSFDKARQAILTSLFCLSLSFVLTACEPTEELALLQFSGPTMGTEYHISIVVDKNREISTDLAELIEEKLNLVNQSMSTYITDSEISLINGSSVEGWIPVSDRLFKVLSTAQDVSRLSDGAFDITIAPLVNLWGFGPEDREGQFPSDDEVATRLKQIGFEKLELDVERQSIKKPVSLTLDLSAIAKGYGSDVVAELLQAKGYTNFMVEIGGELVVKGRNVRGTHWRIGIEAPSFAHGDVQQAIAISDVSVATSGDYRNYFEQDGQRFSHTIDPLNGRPITHKLASVTVITANATEADALATAINVLGYSAGKALAEKNQLAVYFIRKEGDHFVSDSTPQFKQYLSED